MLSELSAVLLLCRQSCQQGWSGVRCGLAPRQVASATLVELFAQHFEPAVTAAARPRPVEPDGLPTLRGITRSADALASHQVMMTSSY
jgi:hypothetical protein